MACRIRERPFHQNPSLVHRCKHLQREVGHAGLAQAAADVLVLSDHHRPKIGQGCLGLGPEPGWLRQIDPALRDLPARSFSVACAQAHSLGDCVDCPWR